MAQEKTENPTGGMVLVVDDEPHQCLLVKRWLELDGHEVETAHSAEDCLRAMSRLMPDALCVDLNMPGMNGLELLERIKTTHPYLPVIVLTAETGVDTIMSATRLGAYDYLTKPVERTKLVTQLRHAVEHNRIAARLSQLEREVEGKGFPGIIGRSAPMQDLFRKIDRLAACDITVMVNGASGTGKELVAQAIHDSSGRRKGPFIALNCAAIPESLQESELFGHEKGAFTGANQRRAGRFEQAHRGTLFLDELAELSLPLQAKLLRALQERRFTRVGGNQEVRSDFRLVAATHRDLGEAVRAGEFREDLFYRIAVFELRVPRLRDRGQDIELLCQHFIDLFAKRHNHPKARLSPEALAVMGTYHWPGNVRELQNTVQHALVVCDGKTIAAGDLPARMRDAVATTTNPPTAAQPIAGDPHAAPQVAAQTPAGGPMRLPAVTLEALEKMAIEQALERTGGNATEAMRQLGLSRATFYRKLKKYELR